MKAIESSAAALCANQGCHEDPALWASASTSFVNDFSIDDGRVALPSGWTLKHGDVLDDAVIAYRLYRKSSDDRQPVVAVLGGISADRHVSSIGRGGNAGWWESMVGPGCAVDTNEFRVLGIDYLGGPGENGRSISLRTIDTHDQAAALTAVLDHLGIERLHAIVGASYGGMVALALGETHASRVERLTVISAAHETHPMATALRGIQRDLVCFGIETGRRHDAVRLARQLAMTTYRTAEEFAERFDSTPEWRHGRPRFPVQDYLESRGNSFADRFSAESFLRLSESIDLHRVEPACISTPTTLLAVTSDVLVPSWQMHALRDSLTGSVSWHEIPSRFGHDAFLKEADVVSRIVRDSL